MSSSGQNISYLGYNTPLLIGQSYETIYTITSQYESLSFMFKADQTTTVHAYWKNDPAEPDVVLAFTSTYNPVDNPGGIIINTTVKGVYFSYTLENISGVDQTILSSSCYGSNSQVIPPPPIGGLTQLATHSTKGFIAANVAFSNAVSWKSLPTFPTKWCAESISPFGGLTDLGNGESAIYRNDTLNDMVFRGEYVSNLYNPLLMRQLIDGVPQSPIVPCNDVNMLSSDDRTYYFVVTVPVGTILTFEWSLPIPYNARNVYISYLGFSLIQIK